MPQHDPDYSVWDEPALSPELAGPPPDEAVTWSRWIAERVAATSTARTWLVTILVALAAGPWSVFGALANSLATMSVGAIVFVVVAPVIEEMMKIAIPLWIVEKKPYLFRSSAQLMICALAGGLAFAAIENVLYLHVYIENPSPALVAWRWTVCVALHTGCSTVAALGLRRIWYRAIARGERPQLSLAAPFLVLAVVLHGTYNGGAWLLELLVEPF